LICLNEARRPRDFRRYRDTVIFHERFSRALQPAVFLPRFCALRPIVASSPVGFSPAWYACADGLVCSVVLPMFPSPHQRVTSLGFSFPRTSRPCPVSPPRNRVFKTVPLMARGVFSHRLNISRLSFLGALDGLADPDETGSRLLPTKQYRLCPHAHLLWNSISKGNDVHRSQGLENSLVHGEARLVLLYTFFPRIFLIAYLTCLTSLNDGGPTGPFILFL